MTLFLGSNPALVCCVSSPRSGATRFCGATKSLRKRCVTPPEWSDLRRSGNANPTVGFGLSVRSAVSWVLFEGITRLEPARRVLPICVETILDSSRSTGFISQTGCVRFPASHASGHTGISSDIGEQYQTAGPSPASIHFAHGVSHPSEPPPDHNRPRSASQFHRGISPRTRGVTANPDRVRQVPTHTADHNTHGKLHSTHGRPQHTRQPPVHTRITSRAPAPITSRTRGVPPDTRCSRTPFHFADGVCSTPSAPTSRTADRRN
jgi:hypothetical protein